MQSKERKLSVAAAGLALVALAACGDTVPEQALLGGGAGAIAGAAVGGSVLTGAAVGAAGNVIYCQATKSTC